MMTKIKVAQQGAVQRQLNSWRNQIKFAHDTYTIDELITKFNYLDFATVLEETQRDWHKEQQERFIESVLLTYPQNSLYFALNKKELIVVDGFQRIKALVEFINNKLVLAQGLTKITALKGFTFNDFTLKERQHFLETALPVVIFKELPESLKIDFAKRLNQITD